MQCAANRDPVQNLEVVSGTCQGDLHGLFAKFVFLGETFMNVNWNCTDASCMSCTYSATVDFSTCATQWGKSMTVQKLRIGNYINVTTFQNPDCTGQVQTSGVLIPGK